jgi:hypothetical protein
MTSQPLETVAEKASRIARAGGATYPETVVALLDPFEQPCGGGTALYANVDGETLPLEAAVAKTRENPVLKVFFQPGGRPDVRKLTPPQYRAVRSTAPQLLGLKPKG